MRPRRRQLRRRLLQLDDPRLRRRRPRSRSRREPPTAGRETPRVYGYVRTSVGADAETRLAKEEGFYRDLHDGYRNHFERLAEPPGTVGVAAENPDDADGMLSAYEALDTVVVRGLASAKFDAMDRVASGSDGPMGADAPAELAPPAQADQSGRRSGASARSYLGRY